MIRVVNILGKPHKGLARMYYALRIYFTLFTSRSFEISCMRKSPLSEGVSMIGETLTAVVTPKRHLPAFYEK